MIELPPEELWQQTKEASGITKDFFDKYFEDREVAYAYKLGRVEVYEEMDHFWAEQTRGSAERISVMMIFVLICRCAVFNGKQLHLTTELLMKCNINKVYDKDS